jgi:hypothetical protein
LIAHVTPTGVIYENPHPTYPYLKYYFEIDGGRCWSKTLFDAEIVMWERLNKIHTFSGEPIDMDKFKAKNKPASHQNEITTPWDIHIDFL